MVEYKCYRCGYIASQKINLKHHLHRKNICNPILEDISIEKMYEMYNFKNDTKQHLNSTQTAPKQHPNDTFEFKKIAPKQHPNDTQTAPKQHLLAPKLHPLAPKKNMCQFCEKTFTRKTGLTKHLKCCKIKKKIIQNEDDKIEDNKIEDDKIEDDKIEDDKIGDDKDIKIKNLEKAYDSLKDKVEDLLIELSKNGVNTTNNTTHMTNSNNTIHNTIHINNYGNENIEYLKKEYLDNLMNGAFTAIPKLIKKIHFNPSHPENHNIKITNKKEPYIKVRKNDKWELQDKRETLETLVDDKYYILEEHYAENEDKKISNHTKEVMELFRNKFNDDKELHKDIQKKSEMIILNNS